MSKRVGWHREWLTRQRVECAKCRVEVRNDPDCVPMLCDHCLAQFHSGMMALGWDRSDAFAIQAVLMDRFLESDGEFFARGMRGMETPEETQAKIQRIETERAGIRALRSKDFRPKPLGGEE